MSGSMMERSERTMQSACRFKRGSRQGNGPAKGIALLGRKFRAGVTYCAIFSTLISTITSGCTSYDYHRLFHNNDYDCYEQTVTQPLPQRVEYAPARRGCARRRFPYSRPALEAEDVAREVGGEPRRL